MNRSRTLILLAIVLALGAVAVLVLLPQQQNPPPTVTPTPVPEIPTTEIIVAAQTIPRGTIITADAVIPRKWPNNALPPDDLIVKTPDLVVGKQARTDILRGQPILQDMVAIDPSQLVARGNDASLFIPPGKVAVAFPIDQLTSVGYAVGSGDRVDVLVAFSIIDVNTEGQFPIVPFNRDLLDELVAAGMTPEAAVAQVIAQSKSADVRPRLLSQLTLQNIEVLRAGEWPSTGVLPRPTATLSPEQAQAPQPPPGGTPTPTPPRPTMFILLVDQQQALILQWLRASGVSISLALRAAGDSAPVSTESVSYQYILTNFNITIPPKTNTVIVPETKSPSAP